MSVKKSGVVAWTGSQTRGKYTFWSFALQGEDKVYYRTGTQSLGIQKGQAIEFEYDEVVNGAYTNLVVNPKTVKISEAPASSAPANTSGAQSSGKQKSPEEKGYWDRKEQRDVDRDKTVSYQAATNTAVAIVGKGIELGFLKIAAPKSAKDSNPFDAYRALVTDVAEDIFRTYQQIPSKYEAIMEEALAAEAEREAYSASAAPEGSGLGDD
jgi:hypothetical protein